MFSKGLLFFILIFAYLASLSLFSQIRTSRNLMNPVDGQYGLKGGFAYEIEMNTKPLGAYLEHIDLDQFIKDGRGTESWKTGSEKISKLKELIYHSYLNRKTLADIKESHPKEFKELTQGIDKQALDSWLNGNKTVIISKTEKTNAEKTQKRSFVIGETKTEGSKILGADGNPISVDAPMIRLSEAEIPDEFKLPFQNLGSSNQEAANLQGEIEWRRSVGARGI